MRREALLLLSVLSWVFLLSAAIAFGLQTGRYWFRRYLGAARRLNRAIGRQL